MRSGVAPGPPQDQVRVTRVYEKTAANPRFRFFGHVELRRDSARAELAAHYHAIVYATGRPTDRALGIPGEDLRGSWPATEFVGWYNGHPDNRDLGLELACERAVVIGNGNVALDVARMLVLSAGELAPTDTADHALEASPLSSVREIVDRRRRGPEQAAFTNPELRSSASCADADVIVDPDELERASPPDRSRALDRGSARQPRDPARLRWPGPRGGPGGSSCASCLSGRDPRRRRGTGPGPRLAATTWSPRRTALCERTRAPAPSPRPSRRASSCRAIGYRGRPLRASPSTRRGG